MCVDILRSIEGVMCVWGGIVSCSIGGVGVMCVGDGVYLLGSCIVLGVCVCLLGSYTVSGVGVCAGGCMRQEDSETLSHAWLVPPWLGTSLLLPKPQGLLPAATSPHHPQGEEAAGLPLLSSLTLMWGWDRLPAPCQEARGQAHSDNLGSKHLRVGRWIHKGLALGAVLCAYKYLKQ